jgi:hypothetical protein
MKKIFDYKFLIILGMSLVVYFLYREVDVLNKRVSDLEKKEITDKKETKPKKLIELPPPPTNENNVEDISDNNEMVEEYSNDEIEHSNDKIYSHDNLDSNSNEQDTLMVDSILNMVKSDNNNSLKQSEHMSPNKLEKSSFQSSEQGSVQISKQSSEQRQEQSSEQSQEQSSEQRQEQSQEQSSEQRQEQSSEQKEDISNVNKNELKLIKKSFSLDALNKKKLEELHEIANKYGININNENGKKKRKVDLAQEIFSKQ